MPLPLAATAPPNTTAPAPPTPTTAAPTPQPEAAALPEVEAKTIEAATGTVAALSVVGGGAGGATRLAMASLGCFEDGSQPPKLPFALHPTQWEIAGSAAAGAVAGNTAIALGFGLVMAVALGAALKWGALLFPRLLEGLDTQGLLRFPSAPFFVFQLLYQGTTYASMSLVIHPPNGYLHFVGFVSFVLCIVIPILVFHAVVRNVPSSARYMVDPRPLPCYLGWLVGPGEWVSLHRQTHWVNRYATAVRTYRQQVAWFAFIEFSASFALSALSAVQATSLVQCGHVKVTTAIVFAVMLVLEAWLWPHARMRDSAADFVGLGLQVVAMMFMGVGYYTGHRNADESWLFASGGMLLMAATCVLLLKMVCDLVAGAYVVCGGRRTRLQALAFDMFDKETPLVEENESADGGSGNDGVLLELYASSTVGDRNSLANSPLLRTSPLTAAGEPPGNPWKHLDCASSLDGGSVSAPLLVTAIGRGVGVPHAAHPQQGHPMWPRPRNGRAASQLNASQVAPSLASSMCGPIQIPPSRSHTLNSTSFPFSAQRSSSNTL